LQRALCCQVFRESIYAASSELSKSYAV
jgi:hypothetical protein